MKTSPEQFEAWLSESEHEHLEFKRAKSFFSFDKLADYCVALANEGGGKLVLGVSDKHPRAIVGTAAFGSPRKTAAALFDRLRIHVRIEVICLPVGRVIVFHIPGRATGTALEHKGRYLMRGGESLLPMSPDRLKSIFAEADPKDFSAEVCPGATLDDLDSRAVARYTNMWLANAPGPRSAGVSHEQRLHDAELIVDGGVTYAALILLGKKKSLDKLLPDAEVIFEYRTEESAVRAAQRQEYRQGFLAFAEQLWQAIDLRNDVQHFQQGLFVRNIRTFNEAVVREAVLNAITHRNYRRHESVMIRQFPRRLEVTSPGAFPEGVTAENILWRQSWRNRRLAESLARCGLVERSGQGANMMFGQCIEEGKAAPDYSRTDDFQVVLDLRGDVQDPMFLRFLEKVGRARSTSFTTEDLLVLDALHRGQVVPQALDGRVQHLVDEGVVERAGRNRHVLSKRFYDFLGRKGEYRRKRGLDRKASKALLLQCIRDHRSQGCAFQDFWRLLPGLSRDQIRSLLRELRADGHIHCAGRTRNAKWFPNISRTP